MERQIGLFEAKNRLSELVAAAERGERIIVTRKGKPVAEIGPIQSGEAARHRAAVEDIRRLADEIRERNGGKSVSSEEILRWIREGRRYE